VIGVHISPIGYATLLSNMDQLQEGAVGVEDPGAEEAEDVGTHDVGQGLMSQWWKTMELWLRTQLWWNTQ